MDWYNVIGNGDDKDNDKEKDKGRDENGDESGLGIMVRATGMVDAKKTGV